VRNEIREKEEERALNELRTKGRNRNIPKKNGTATGNGTGADGGSADVIMGRQVCFFEKKREACPRARR